MQAEHQVPESHFEHPVGQVMQEFPDIQYPSLHRPQELPSQHEAHPVVQGQQLPALKQYPELHVLQADELEQLEQLLGQQIPFTGELSLVHELQYVEDVQAEQLDGHAQQLPLLKQYPAMQEVQVEELVHVLQTELQA